MQYGGPDQHDHADLFLCYLRGPPRTEAIAAIKNSIGKTYGKKGPEIVQMNLTAVDHTLAHLSEAKIPENVVEHAPVEAPIGMSRPSSCGRSLAR